MAVGREPGVRIEAATAAATSQAEVLELDESVGWTAYTDDPGLLMRALAGAHRIVMAGDGDRLVGLSRSISDGVTIVYLQDVLVASDAHRKGIGTALVSTLLASYGDIRQQILLTDDEQGQRRFYESLGFIETRDTSPPVRAREAWVSGSQIGAVLDPVMLSR